MQIKFEDLEKGDEIIIPSNSNLKYLRLISKTKSGNWKCSISMSDENFTKIFNTSTGPYQHTFLRKHHLEPDINKHDKVFYLNNKENYVDMWLVKRE